MTFVLRTVVLLLLATIQASTTFARTTNADPENAWKHYQENDQDIAPGLRFPHASCFKAAAAAYDLPETLLLAVARGESDFEPTARSKANAHGVMQILWPTTAHHLGIYRLTQLYDPCTNIDAGARYLRELVDRFDGNLHLALAAYNYGPDRIDSDRDNIPEGARWYSDYIYRHLDYVLGNRKQHNNTADALYSELGHTELVRFSEPYRAAAFVAGLERQYSQLQLDWFRKGVGDFAVVLSYADKDEFRASARLLSAAGFRLN